MNAFFSKYVTEKTLPIFDHRGSLSIAGQGLFKPASYTG